MLCLFFDGGRAALGHFLIKKASFFKKKWSFFRKLLLLRKIYVIFFT